MTGYLAHDANLARLHDMKNSAGRRRAARGRARTDVPAPSTTAIAIRRATEVDRLAIERLAALDSSTAPSGEILVAEVDHEPQAAIQVATGATIADPFRPTAHLVELLSLRAAGLRTTTRTTRRLRLRANTAQA
jgi:hypothetical protein